MIKRLIALITPPHYDGEDDQYRANFIHISASLILLILVISEFFQVFKKTPDLTIIVLPALMGVMLLTLYSLRKGYLRLSGIILVVLTWIGITFQALTAEGIKDVIVFAYIALVLLASIITDWRTSSLVLLFSLAALWALALLQVNGVIAPDTQPPHLYARDLTFIFTIIGFLIYFSTSSLREAIVRASKSESSLRDSNKELQELNQTLEERVSSRTAELELANQQNEKRAREFEAIAQVARATTSNESLETLLPRLTVLISEQFGFYHTGIFLLDESREHAVLRAANSPGGKRMLERKHRLEVGQTGIVGFVSATGNPRIALDVGSDAVFFNNPDLPDTRSEIALPLLGANEIIGVLDVQSTISNAFQEEDIEILSTLADQVAAAIQNARSFETMQELLREAQRVSSTYMQDAWQILQSEETTTGYRVTENEVSALTKPLRSIEVKKAIQNKQTVMESGETAVLAIPIRMRDDVIGVIDIRTSVEHEWDEDEVDIAEAVAERLALALEASLLLKTTQRQAEIERIKTDISGKIGATTQFDSILRTAAEELSRVLGGSEVLVQIQPLESFIDTKNP
jgi:GAF domain-containing protein